MNATTISQTEQIRAHLQSGKPITPLTALKLYGSLRLGARIAELREEGMVILTKLVKDANTGKRYAEYKLMTKS